jgi:hypothetical protein
VADVFGKKIDLGARRFSVRPAASYFTFAGHGSVIALDGQRLQYRRVKIFRENALKSQMVERRVVRASSLRRFHDEIGQVFD